MPSSDYGTGTCSQQRAVGRLCVPVPYPGSGYLYTTGICILRDNITGKPYETLLLQGIYSNLYHL